MAKIYNIIIPSIDLTGPVNVALDLGQAAFKCGYEVRVYYLSSIKVQRDLSFAKTVSKFVASDFIKMEGVVHTHCLRPDLLSFVLRINRKIFLITTIHNYFLIDIGFQKSKFKTHLSWLFWKLSLKNFDQVICISESMRNYYRSLSININFELIYNFRSKPDISTCLSKSDRSWLDYQVNGGKKVLTFVGSVSKRKNFKSLYEFIARSPRFCLLVCGEGELYDDYLASHNSENLQSNVRFLGHVANPSGVMKHSDALVLPSFAEGFPLVVLEAASVGVPTLLSDIPVHNELVELRLGMVFDHVSFDDFEDAFDICQSEYYLSERLKSVWAQKFTPEVGFQKYESLFAARNLR